MRSLRFRVCTVVVVGNVGHHQRTGPAAWQHELYIHEITRDHHLRHEPRCLHVAAHPLAVLQSSQDDTRLGRQVLLAALGGRHSFGLGDLDDGGCCIMCLDP